jgi:Fic family protein
MDNKLCFDLLSELPVINSALRNIDEFNKTWLSLERIKQERILKELKSLSTIQSIGSSTRIEGSELSDEEVKNLIENLNINQLTSRDTQEIAGYNEVLELIFENHKHILISESYIRQLHGLLLKYSDKDTRHKGCYKSLSNKVVAKYLGGSEKIIFNTTEPYLVETEIQTLLEWTNKNLSKKEIHPLIVIAAFVYEFLSIHPFQDGSGRLSRLLTSLLLLKKEYFFIRYISFEYVIEARKKEYYQNLMECQKNRYSKNENIARWVIFFLDCVEDMIFRLQAKLNDAQINAHNNFDINARQKKIMALFNEDSALSISDIWTKLNINRDTLKKDLAFLVRENCIERKGSGRGTWYEITKS